MWSQQAAWASFAASGCTSCTKKSTETCNRGTVAVVEIGTCDYNWSSLTTLIAGVKAEHGLPQGQEDRAPTTLASSPCIVVKDSWRT